MKPLLKHLRQKKPQMGELSYDEKYGATLTAYVPIIDSTGAMVGVVGADFNADSIYKLMNEKSKN